MSYNCLQNELSSNLVCEPISSWGGKWTQEKLDAFEKYVNAYLTIMNKHRDKNNWKLIYFDGFAGSGSRGDIKPEASTLLTELFDKTYLKQEELDVYKSAAERVLNIKQRGFDYYYFIDKDEKSSQNLKELLSPFKDNKKLEFRNSDANEQLKELSKALHKNPNLASLVLLDPFGMQVNWDSIETLKETRTDLWILIPTGVIVNRLLDRKGELTHIDKLTSFFGKDEDFLRKYFYSKRQEITLFGEEEIIEKVKKPIERIAELYIEQLKTIYKFVTSKPLVLYNSRNTPIFHFACASNNETALKIAKDIIYKQQGI